MKIKDFRQEKNLSQTDLALKVGVSQSAVAKWETGETIPATRHLIKLVEIFNCTIDELVR